MRRLIFILCMAMTIVANAQDKKKPTEVMLETTAGNIRLRLYDSTPLHRDNFVKLVNLHVYDSLLFHRVIKDFMIQCGDPKSKNAEPGQFLGEGDLDWTVEQELRLPQIYHRRGVLAAAREPDDANPYGNEYKMGSTLRSELAWEDYYYAIENGLWDDSINPPEHPTATPDFTPTPAPTDTPEPTEVPTETPTPMPTAKPICIFWMGKARERAVTALSET